MARIVVLGAGICGLSAGLLLRRDGHEVTVLERDDAALPASPAGAWEDWQRGGVVQFRQAHYLQPAGWAVLKRTLPDVAAALQECGGKLFDPLSLMPPTLSGAGQREDDERFQTVTARRPLIEHVLGRAAASEPGLDLRRGAAVAGLTVRDGDGGKTPHVTGVRLQSGEQLAADLVVDATGRRSQMPRWLSEVGAGPVEEETEDSGFIYYTRFFEAPRGQTPQAIAPLLMPVGSFSILTLPADNASWSVTVYISTGDRPLKRFRELDVWTALVKACPLQAHWLEGEPLTGILPMSGVSDRYCRLAPGGEPAATGVALLGDAAACTNPSLGRGMTLGLLHVELLRETVREHLGDPLGFALAWDAATEAALTPWYRETVEENRYRRAEIEALRSGAQPPLPAEGSTDALRIGLMAAMLQDPDLFRAFLESRCCIKRLADTFQRPGMTERIAELSSGTERLPPVGPDREQVLRLVGA